MTPIVRCPVIFYDCSTRNKTPFLTPNFGPKQLIGLMAYGFKGLEKIFQLGNIAVAKE